MIHVDGSLGEGGGQVLRTSLALSAVTGAPVRIENIRAGRPKPGLKHQHVACVRAAQSICNAHVDGLKVGATRLTFTPNAMVGGEHVVHVGTAGSVTLVAHTVVPALVHKNVAAHIVIEGGTHVPLAPVYEHFAYAFIPALRALGARVDVALVRHGFMPEGGGRIEITVHSAPPTTKPFTLLERGPVTGLTLYAVGRGVDEVRAAFPGVHVVEHAGRGQSLALAIAFRNGVELVSSLRGARALIDEAQRFIAADVPVGEHLADQLLLPLALGCRGAFRTTAPSLHTRTNADVIGLFRRELDVVIDCGDDVVSVR